MHAAIQLAEFWAVAFLTLCTAVLLMGIFYSLIENDLELHTLGKEAMMAGVASLIEAVSVWLVVLFIPPSTRALGLRALIIPALIVALIYKVGHLEDWSRYDVLFLLVFQVVIGCLGACLVSGRFEAAIYVFVGFGIVLAVIALFVRSL